MNDRLHAALSNRCFFKAISGLDVFDPARVLPVARAALHGADAVDVAADPALVAQVREAAPGLTVFASSTDPQALAGSTADVLELGNYDAIYRSGEQPPTADQVLEWTRALWTLTAGQVPICVTIPLHLPLGEQIDLARMLQAAGAAMLQIEGALGTNATATAAQRLQDALQLVSALSEVVTLPLIVAGGLDEHGAAVAIGSGASGIGIGKFLKDAGDEAQMTSAVRQVRIALAGATRQRTPIKR